MKVYLVGIKNARSLESCFLERFLVTNHDSIAMVNVVSQSGCFGMGGHLAIRS